MSGTVPHVPHDPGPAGETAEHLTVRVEGATATTGTDDGACWALPAEAVETVRALCRPAGRAASGGATPAGRASYGEADMLRVLDAPDVVVRGRRAHWVQRIAPDPARFAPVPDGAPVRSRPLATVLAERTSHVFRGRVPGSALHALVSTVRQPRRSAADSTGRRWESRPYPSAGGTHSVDLLVRASGVDGWADGWYRWQAPGRCAPVLVSGIHEAERAVGRALRHAPEPAALLLAVADLRLLHDRYPNGASLAWRDTGALLAVAQLVATDLSLTSTLVGASAPVDTAGTTDLPGDVRLLGALAVTGQRPA